MGLAGVIGKFVTKRGATVIEGFIRTASGGSRPSKVVKYAKGSLMAKRGIESCRITGNNYEFRGKNGFFFDCTKLPNGGVDCSAGYIPMLNKINQPDSFRKTISNLFKYLDNGV